MVEAGIGEQTLVHEREAVKARREDFIKWRTCKNSGDFVRFKKAHGKIRQIGYCSKKESDIDMNIECNMFGDCHEPRAHHKTQRTPLKKMRIKKGAERNAKRRQERGKYITKGIDAYV